MVVCLRVDERMIHGQVVTNWIRFLNLTNLIVASDRAAKDELESMSLKMAVPDGVKCVVVSIEKAVTILLDPRSEKLRIMVIAETPQDGNRIVQAVKGIQEINVANYGNINNPDEPGKTVLTNYLRVNEKELAAIREMAQTGIPIFQQMIPAKPRTDLSKV